MPTMQDKAPGNFLRQAKEADLPRVYEVRHGTAENRLANPALVTSEEVDWYMRNGVFLVSEEAGVVQGFVCANPQTGYVWALFVIDGMHGRGHGKALLGKMLDRLYASGNRQAFLTTGKNTRAAEFYRRQGWTCVGASFGGELVFRKALDDIIT